jgi:glutaredoxin
MTSGGTGGGGTGGAALGQQAAARHQIITLLSRPGCHLCDDARAVISRVAGQLGVAWEERDITQSRDDLLAYAEQIPVTLIDGVQHDFWRVDEDRLRAALRE